MSVRARIVLAVVSASAAVVVTVGAIAALGETVWQDDGIAVCDEDKAQSDPAVVSDGNNGAIVTWLDRRDDDYGIYAQRMDSSGNAQWAEDGVSVAMPSIFNLSEPRIATDGSGGAVVAWTRFGNGWDMYAQRVYSDGTPAWSWAPIGVSLCVESSTQRYSQMTSDGSGGAIVAWRDYRSGSEFDIYAQRVYSNGVTAWTDAGVSLCVAADDQTNLQIAPDGAGGAIAVWEDDRDSTTNLSDIYAQRVDSLGNRVWISGGVGVRVASGDQTYPKIASDGAGGAFVTWQDYLHGDLYVQRLYPDGTMAWPTGGVSVCTASSNQNQPDMAPDGAGGAVLAWQDGRPDGDGTDIFAQCIDSDGNTLWQTDGVAVCHSDGEQLYAEIASDGLGGALVTWWDYRDEASTNIDVYAQRVDASGNAVWQTDGVTVCAASERQDYPQIVSDGLWGAIIAWEDSRGTDDDIYAQRVGNLEVVNLPLVAKNHSD